MTDYEERLLTARQYGLLERLRRALGPIHLTGADARVAISLMKLGLAKRANGNWFHAIELRVLKEEPEPC